MINITDDKRLNPEMSGYHQILYKGTISAIDGFVYQMADATSAILTQFTFGEPIAVYAIKEHYCFVQSQRDQYCGWIHEDTISNLVEESNYRSISHAPILEKADLKSTAKAQLPIDSLLTLNEKIGAYYYISTLRGYIHEYHIAPCSMRYEISKTALSQLGRAYVWGGRGTAGIDCSAFVQLCYRFSGIELPRDSDLQWQYMQQHHLQISLDNIKENDLLFVKGHVMLALDQNRLIHATANAMQVVIEPINSVLQRIQRQYHLRTIDAYRFTNAMANVIEKF